MSFWSHRHVVVFGACGHGGYSDVGAFFCVELEGGVGLAVGFLGFGGLAASTGVVAICRSWIYPMLPVDLCWVCGDSGGWLWGCHGGWAACDDVGHNCKI